MSDQASVDLPASDQEGQAAANGDKAVAKVDEAAAKDDEAASDEGVSDEASEDRLGRRLQKA